MTVMLALSLVACTDDGTELVDSGSTAADSGTSDTQDTQDTQDTSPPCTIAVSGTEPAADAAEVFWRDPLQVWFDGSFLDRSLPGVSLTLDVDGSAVAAAQDWDEGVDSVVVTPSQPLMPETAYTLTVDACGVTSAVPFTTSVYGTPLTDGSESLRDRTWVLQTGNVDWTEPDGAAELLNAFFTDPLLIGVQDVRGDTIDLLVAMGVFTDLAGFEQLPGLGTWDVFDVDLSQGAWFSAVAEAITFTYDTVPIDVHDFALQGTFAPDGSVIAGASIQGLVDTRNIALLFGLDQPDFICTTYARDYNLECTDCPDGEFLCMDLAGEHISLDEQPGLTLERLPQDQDTDTQSALTGECP